MVCKVPENSSNPIIAYMMITNITKSAMCNKGTMARKIEFNTTCKPVNKQIKRINNILIFYSLSILMHIKCIRQFQHINI